MSIRFNRWLILVLLLVCSIAPATAQEPADSDQNTNTWGVTLAPGSDPNAVAADLGFINLGTIGLLENTYLFGLSTTATKEPRAVNNSLRSAPQVQWFEQQVARQQSLRVPTDPLFEDQWFLDNTFPSEEENDINVVPAWDAGYIGTGVQVAVVDDGLQFSHPDLAPNYVASGSYDFNGGDSNPSPTSPGDGHGTSVGGLIAARDDGTACGVGVAYRASLSGLRLVAGPSTDAMEANALNYGSSVNQIYNNSWGPSDNGSGMEAPGPLTLAALQAGVINGRGGLGSIYVWAAGNGRENDDNVNADGYANSRYTIAVGGVGADGQASWFSEPGAPMLVTAPGGGDFGAGEEDLTTTDLMGASGYDAGNCTSGFSGTSASAPVVSGVVALMLQANPNLTWRDVQHILVRSAFQNDPFDSEWTTNGAGYLINHNYGFGMVDADAATIMAATWETVDTETSTTSGRINLNQLIPSTVNGPGLSLTTPISRDLSVEYVEVILKTVGSPSGDGYRGDLEVTLVSPDGTESRLMEVRPGDSAEGFNNWKLTSVRHWDESSVGTWTLRIVDRDPGFNDSRITGWQLTVYGTVRAPAVPTLNAPANNAVISASAPFTGVTLSWDNGSSMMGVSGYEIEFDSVQPMNQTISLPAVGSLTRSLEPGTYYWRVRAMGSSGFNSDWSSVRQFTVSMSQAAVPFRNRFTTTSQPLSWSSLTWARGYHVQVANAASFSLISLMEDNSSLTAADLSFDPQITNDGIYYWRVRARDANDRWGTWSATQTFTVDLP